MSENFEDEGVKPCDTCSVYSGLTMCQVLYELLLNVLTLLPVVKTVGSGVGLPEFKCWCCHWPCH